MVGFEQLKTTEEISRFLRNKDTEIIDIYTFSTEKLLNESDDLILLPQGEKFILELLIERISQSNKLTEKFIYSEYTWKLFNCVWEKFNNDSKLITSRSKILINFRFGDVFTKILKGVYSKDLFKNETYVKFLIKSMTYLVNTIRIHLSDEQNILLINYLLLFIIDFKLYAIDTNNSILLLVSSIFKLNNSNTLNYDTKHKTEFARSCLANLLIAYQIYTSNEKIKSDLKSIFYKTLFVERDDKITVKFVEQFSKVESNKNLGEDEVLFLIRIIITKVDLKQLEDIIKILINLYPSYSNIILKEITDMNKTLSNEFLSTLVENSLKLKDDESIKLIKHCIKRSSDVAFKYNEEICELCSININENSLNLFKELIESYIKTREIDLFVKLWDEFIIKYPNSVFETDEIIDFASSKIILFSYLQLSTLVKQEISKYTDNPEVQPVFLLAVCKGLFKAVSGTIQNSLSKILIQHLYKLKQDLLLLLNIKSETSWKLKFYILNLFEQEEIETETTEILEEKYVNNEYYYYSILRIIEQDVSKSSETFLKKFKDFFIKKSSESFKIRIFSRWFILVENLYDEKIIQLLIENLLQTLSLEKISLILQNTLIQTQNKIMKQFINKIIENEKYLILLKKISPYALNKNEKIKILDILYQKINEEYMKESIIKILSIPTYKSKIETDFKCLVELAKIKDEKLDLIIDMILNIHIKQPIESNNYLTNAFKLLNLKIEALNETNCTKNEPYLKLSIKLIKQSKNSKFEDQRNELILKSFNKFYKLLTNDDKISINDSTTIVKYLTNVNFENGDNLKTPKNIKEIINKLGNKFSEESEEFKSILFGFMCSLNKVYKPRYIFALYIILQSNNNDNEKYINFFINKLTQDGDLYIESWFSICNSIKEASKEDFHKYVELSSYFINNVGKFNKSENIKLIHFLFVRTISEILTYMESQIYSNDDIDIFLKSLKDVLSNKIWLFTQYTMEITLVLITFISNDLVQNQENKSIDEITKYYIEICQIFSSIILYQRKRISNRHHLIDIVLISLMKTLIICSDKLSPESGLTFERLISNICEPNINNISIKNHSNSKDAEINEALLQIKSSLRKYLPVIILNYIRFYLQYKINLTIKQYLDNVIYMIFDLLTVNEMNYINKSLDNHSRVVFRNIYDDYKKFYKWTEE